MLIIMKWRRFILPGRSDEDRRAVILLVKNNSSIARRFICRGLLAATIVFPVPGVMAEGISYDYAQADYISDTFDPNGSIRAVEGNGIGFAMSLSFAPAFAVRLAVASTTFRDFHGVRVDSSKVTMLGVTAHTSVADNTDVFTNVSVIKAEVEANNGVDKFSENDYSAIVDVGLRHFVTDKVELEAMVSQVKMFGYTLNSTMIGGRFYFRKRLSVGASYVANDIHDSLLITARMDI